MIDNCIRDADENSDNLCPTWGRFFNLTLLIVKLGHTLEVVKVEIQIWRSKRTSKETGWGLFLILK